MGFFDDFFKSPSEKGKEDGTRGSKDVIKYAMDKHYREGYDHGEGLKNGSESTGLVDDITNEMAAMGRSGEYKRSYKRARATHNTAGDVPPKLFGDKESSGGGSSYSSNYGGRSSNSFSDRIGSILGWCILGCILAGVVLLIICFLFLGVPALIEKHQGITDQGIKKINGVQQVIPQEAKEPPFTIALLVGSYLFAEPSSSADRIAIIKGPVPIGVYNIQGDWFMVKWKDPSTNGEEKIGWFHHSSEPYYYLSEGAPTLKQVGAKWSLIILLPEKDKTTDIEKIGNYYGYINDGPIPDSAVPFAEEGDWILWIDRNDSSIYKSRNDGSISIRDAE